MYRKGGILVIGLLCFLLVQLPGCSRKEPPFLLGWESSMVKVPYDRPFLQARADTVTISAAGGEYESFQVIIHAVAESLRNVRVEATDMRGGKGRIGRKNVSVNPVGYIETTVVSKHYPSRLGWWPDPLLELTDFPVPRGQVQPVWVTVHVPRGTPAGWYRGQVRVRAGGTGERVLHVKLRVWGFDLPVRPNLKTLTWVAPMDKFYGYEPGSEREIETLKRYYDLLLQYHLGPGGNILTPAGSITRPQDWLLRYRPGPGGSMDLSEYMIQYCMERGMNCFIMETIPNLKRRKLDNYSPEYKRGLVKKLSGFVMRFGPRGWLDGVAYVYNYDEVDRDHWPLAKEMYRLVKSVSPKLRVIQCLNIPEGIKAMAGYADTWDVYVAQYEETGVEERKKAGDEVWLAICCYPSVRPNLFYEYPAIDARILGWMCWFTGASGFEYWSPNNWRDNKSTPGLRGGWTAHTFLDYNGDGCLVYPGPDGRPLASQRLANLRDGFEDYEYFHLLKELGGRAEIPPGVISSPTHYTDDPALVYQARADVAVEIEALLAAGK